ncbi:hypothetical protein FQV37_1508 [Psychrobacter nivimaris]|uniref:Uncharacterized protein n=1 Tax=Psychrobacter nivimaris TaxID=281738 RepID=A0A6N7BY78_9GAMM|nr:hypothetical protein FQV37_1508 [Psychrobacter nivimaris]
MSLPIIIDYHYVWQSNVRRFIYHDTAYRCHHHLARRLRQAFFMENFL